MGLFDRRSPEERAKDDLPNEATNIRLLGNGWLYFDLHGKTFLFYKQREGYEGYSAVTQVTEK